jgi:hypothetical protein
LTEQKNFKISYFFDVSKFAANYVISFEVYEDFEGMKAGKSAIQPC